MHFIHLLSKRVNLANESCEVALLYKFLLNNFSIANTIGSDSLSDPNPSLSFLNSCQSLGAAGSTPSPRLGQWFISKGVMSIIIA